MDWVGFRFRPTQQEIISYFLETKMCRPAWPCSTVPEVKNVCKFEPWDLLEHSPLPGDDQVWYFFNVPVSKSPNGRGTERTTNTGYWKVTGYDHPIWDKQGKKVIGFKKYLVFHKGRARNGVKTNWVMHEYHSNNVSSHKEEYVLFRLKRKSGDSSDTCDEHLAFDSGNHAENTASQVNLLDNNGLDRNTLPHLLSSIQPERGTSCSNGADRIHLPTLFLSTQPDRRTSYSNGADGNPFSALFSSNLPDRRTSYSNGADGHPLSAMLSSIQSDRRTPYSNGAEGDHLSALFSSIQSDRRNSYSNGVDGNPLSEIFSSVQSGKRNSYSNGADGDPLSALFSSIQSDRRNSYSNGADGNPLSEIFSSVQSGKRNSYSNGADRDPLSALLSSIQSEQGTSYSRGADAAMFSSIQPGQRISYRLNDEWNLSDSHFDTCGQEDAFMYFGDSRDACADVFAENGSYQEENLQLELHTSNSDTEMFEMDHLYEFQMAEFPTTPRTCKAQYTLKSHHAIQDKCVAKTVQLQGEVSSKAVRTDEVTEAAMHVVDLPRKGNNTEKFDKDQKTAQTTNAKASSKFTSGGRNKKGSLFILQETPPFGHKNNPPLVYIGNMLVSFVVIVFIIREMASLH